MEMLQLKLFISLSQTRNFTKTAKEFFMSQPAVSNNIKALESSLGVMLFKRDKRGVSLTQEGQEFVDYANSMLVLRREAETRLLNISKGRQGYIKIALLSSMSEFFSQCLTEFYSAHKGVQISVFKMEGNEMSRALKRREFDLYFINRFMLSVDDSVEFIMIGSDQLRLYLNKRDVDKVDIDDFTSLQKSRFVAVSDMDFALSGHIKNICIKRGLVPDVINYYNNAEMVLLAVNSGIGMAILPHGISHFYNFPNIVSFPIDGDDAKLAYAVAWHKEKLSPEVQKFLNISSIRNLIGK